MMQVSEGKRKKRKKYINLKINENNVVEILSTCKLVYQRSEAKTPRRKNSTPTGTYPPNTSDSTNLTHCPLCISHHRINGSSKLTSLSNPSSTTALESALKNQFKPTHKKRNLSISASINWIHNHRRTKKLCFLFPLIVTLYSEKKHKNEM